MMLCARTLVARSSFLVIAVAALASAGCGGSACGQEAVEARGTCEARCQNDRPACGSECDRLYDVCMEPCADVPCRDACAQDRSDCVQGCNDAENDCRQDCADIEAAVLAGCD